MTATINTGNLTLDKVLSGRRLFYVRDEIMPLIKDPGIFAKIMLSKDFPQKNRKAVYDPVMKWTEQDIGKTTFQANAVTGSDVTLGTAGDYKYFEVGDTIEDENQQKTFRVTAVNSSTNTITVSPIDGSSAVAANDYLKLLGSAKSGTSTSGEGKSLTETERENAVQIFEYNIEYDLFTANARLKFGNEREIQAQTAFGEFIRRIERTALFSEYSKAESSSLYTTSGIFKQIKTYGNYVDDSSSGAPVTLTDDLLKNFMDYAFMYDSNSEKALIASSEYVKALFKLGVAKLQLDEKVKVYGIDFNKISIMGKTFLLYEHRELNDSLGASIAGYKNCAIAMDLEDLQIAYFPIDVSPNKKMEGTEVMLLKDIQENDSKARKDQLLWVGGFNVLNAKRHAIHWGISA